MTGNGFIKIYRSSENSALYLSEPFTKWQAWVDLIMLAYYNESVIYVRGIKVETRRGCVYMSSEDLAKRWKWSRGKVLRFLMYLETEQQIVQQKSNVITCISISNYDLYQSDGTTNGTTDGTTKQKKEPKKNREEDIPPYNPPKGETDFSVFGKFDYSFVEERYAQTFYTWLDYKRERKEKYKSQSSIKACYNKMVKESGNSPDTASKMVEQSMANNWAGLFPLKANDSLPLGFTLKDNRTEKYENDIKGW